MDDLTKLKRRIRQLERARQSWKQRVASKQLHIRYLRVKARDLASSRDHWKQRALDRTDTRDAPPATVLLPLDTHRPLTPPIPTSPHPEPDDLGEA